MGSRFFFMLGSLHVEAQDGDVNIWCDRPPVSR
jgi:hypothetical protein